MIFVDSNIPMYLIGAAHPHKVDAQRMLERHVALGERLVTDAEVFQEVLHRYTAIARKDAIQPAFDALTGIVDSILPITERDVRRAKELLLGARAGASARDVLHVAVMQNHEIEHIMTFDQGFDSFPGIRRVIA